MVNYFRRISTFLKRLFIEDNYPVPTAHQCNKSILDRHSSSFRRRTFLIITGGIVTFIYAHISKNKRRLSQANEKTPVRLRRREQRFIKFSSVEFDDQLYMTPQDFIDSMVELEPRPRVKRHTLVIDDIWKIREATPPLNRGSPRLFRNLRDIGLISYTEYLFLLSALTKPKSGFRIAFNMFDTDGNECVDKDEFLVIRRVLSGPLREHGIDETAESIEELEKLKVITTLQTHFFGPDGNKVLHYDGFHKFLNNLQKEVLQIEFNAFAKDKSTITELDFGKILLRFTDLDTNQFDAYLEPLQDRMKDDRGFTFKEFHDFCRFLYNLEDFSIAMNMYNLAKYAISKEEFSRGVKISTGYTLSTHIVDTVFAIFDRNGDGRLSYEEFIAIMKDRVRRGFKPTSKKEGWDAFRYCVRIDLKTRK